CESNVFGVVHGYGAFIQNFAKLLEGKREFGGSKEVDLFSKTSDTDLSFGATSVITDPPYVGNVNYAELADFFYVWLRLVLKDRYPWFAPEDTPKREEIIQNQVRRKSQDDFFRELASAFGRVRACLPESGLLVFTFHHK